MCFVSAVEKHLQSNLYKKSVFLNPSHSNKIRLFSIAVSGFLFIYKTLTKQTVYLNFASKSALRLQFPRQSAF